MELDVVGNCVKTRECVATEVTHGCEIFARAACMGDIVAERVCDLWY